MPLPFTLVYAPVPLTVFQVPRSVNVNRQVTGSKDSEEPPRFGLCLM